MNVEVAESLAGVVRLLRRAAELAWAEAEAEPGSARQVLALGIDIASDEAARPLLPALPEPGPVPVGDDPAELLRSAERLLAALDSDGSDGVVRDLRRQVEDLVWEANTGADA